MVLHDVMGDGGVKGVIWFGLRNGDFGISYYVCIVW